MRIIKKIHGKGLRKSKGLMFAYKCGLRILILHIILPTREQYKNKHTMSYIIQSVNLQTQVHYSELFFRSMGPPSPSRGEGRGQGGFHYLDMPFHVLKFVITVSVAQTISCETRAVKINYFWRNVGSSVCSLELIMSHQGLPKICGLAAHK